MAFDYIFKRAMRELLSSCESNPEPVGDLPLQIDMVVHCKNGMPGAIHIPLLERNFAAENLFEYKSERDKRLEKDLSKLLGYVGLYCNQHDIGIEEMRSRLTAWYITAKRPSFLAGLLASDIASETSNAGLYEIHDVFPCPCRVLVCDELDVNDDNIPLLALGSIDTIRKAIRQLARAPAILRHAMDSIISLIYLFYRDEVKDMTEMNEILPADVRRSMKNAIMDIGLDEVIKEIGIDEVIKVVGLDALLEHVDSKDIEKILKKRKAKGVKRSSDDT